MPADAVAQQLPALRAIAASLPHSTTTSSTSTNSNSCSRSSLSDLLQALGELPHGLRSSDGSQNHWIIKPVGLSCGQGIHITHGMLDTLHFVASLQCKCVVQQYIERPLLLKNRKFDLRQWVLVTSLDPLLVYGFSECYVRLTSKEFTLDEDLLSDPLVHLCNHAIQKAALDGDSTSSETMMTQQQLCNELPCFHSMVLPQMQSIALAAVGSVRDMLVDPYGNGVEWLGLDLMVCEDFSVKLIEVNTSPDISYSTSVTTPLVRAAVDDLFVLLLDEHAGDQRRGSTAPRVGDLEDPIAVRDRQRWCCWYAEGKGAQEDGRNEDKRAAPFNAFAFTRNKRSVAVMKKDYALPDVELVSRTISLLRGDGDSDVKGVEDCDEF